MFDLLIFFLMLLVASRKVLLLILAALWAVSQTGLRMASLNLMGLSILYLSTNPQTVSMVSILSMHNLNISRSVEFETVLNVKH
jgi:hypothetical protein